MQHLVHAIGLLSATTSLITAAIQLAVARAERRRIRAEIAQSTAKKVQD